MNYGISGIESQCLFRTWFQLYHKREATFDKGEGVRFINVWVTKKKAFDGSQEPFSMIFVPTGTSDEPVV